MTSFKVTVSVLSGNEEAGVVTAGYSGGIGVNVALRGGER